MGMQPNDRNGWGWHPFQPWWMKNTGWGPWWAGMVRNCPRCGYPVSFGPAQNQQPVVQPQPVQPQPNPVVGDVRTQPVRQPQHDRVVRAASPNQYGAAYNPYFSQ